MAERFDFGMRTTHPSMPSLTDNDTIPYDHATDTRIRVSGEEPPGGELQRPGHEWGIAMRRPV
jgi:hypothetical protein